jgi:hypothetical protein
VTFRHSSSFYLDDAVIGPVVAQNNRVSKRYPAQAVEEWFRPPERAGLAQLKS